MWKRSIILVWGQIAQHKNANLFAGAVSEADAPEYRCNISLIFNQWFTQLFQRHCVPAYGLKQHKEKCGIWAYQDHRSKWAVQNMLNLNLNLGLGERLDADVL